MVLRRRHERVAASSRKRRRWWHGARLVVRYCALHISPPFIAHGVLLVVLVLLISSWVEEERHRPAKKQDTSRHNSAKEYHRHQSWREHIFHPHHHGNNGTLVPTCTSLSSSLTDGIAKRLVESHIARTLALGAYGAVLGCGRGSVSAPTRALDSFCLFSLHTVFLQRLVDSSLDYSRLVFLYIGQDLGLYVVKIHLFDNNVSPNSRGLVASLILYIVRNNPVER